MFSGEYREVFKSTYFEDHLRMAASVVCPETYLEPFQTSMMALFYENSQRLLAVSYFRKKNLSEMFDWVLNTCS